MKIGVITLPFSPNYGWLMQAYALQKTLESQGHDVVLISRKWNLRKSNSGLLNKILRPLYYNINCGGLFRFYNRHINKTRVYRNVEELKTVTSEYHLDAVVVGSDQVWRIEDTRGVGYNFFLDFVPSGIIKLSYAASFGNDCWKGNSSDNMVISRLLSGFSGISVRESSGIIICKQMFDKDALCHIDPTFLLTSSQYDATLNHPDKYKGTHKLVTYILDPSPEKDSFIDKVATKKGLSVVKLYPTAKNNRLRFFRPMIEWLQYIRNSEYVIVDSFHGLAFCLIYHKEFVVIANKHRGNTRFENILSRFGLLDRLLFDTKSFNIDELTPIDSHKIDMIISSEIKKSKDYLNSILGGGKV